MDKSSQIHDILWQNARLVVLIQTWEFVNPAMASKNLQH